MMDKEEIQEKKKNKIAEIEERFAKNQTGVFAKLDLNDDIKTTKELAQNYTSVFSKDGFVIKNSTFTSGFHLIIIHVFQIGLLFADKEFKTSAVFYIAETILLIAAISGWSMLLNKKTKIKIDSSGLYILFMDINIEWQDFLTSHIRRSYIPKSKCDDLIINLYKPFADSFEEKYIDLTYLDTSDSEISAAIEFYKDLWTKNKNKS